MHHDFKTVSYIVTCIVFTKMAGKDLITKKWQSCELATEKHFLRAQIDDRTTRDVRILR